MRADEKKELLCQINFLLGHKNRVEELCSYLLKEAKEVEDALSYGGETEVYKELGDVYLVFCLICHCYGFRIDKVQDDGIRKFYNRAECTLTRFKNGVDSEIKFFDEWKKHYTAAKASEELSF